jgi:FAD binding domain of DNA photolyase
MSHSLSLSLSLSHWHKQYIYEPWKAPISVQKQCGVIVGENYPYAIVDHEISSANMSRMKEAYDAHRDGRPMPAPPEPLPTSQQLEQAPATKRRRL